MFEWYASSHYTIMKNDKPFLVHKRTYNENMYCTVVIIDNKEDKMGIHYKFKCTNCDYEEDFYIGGGFFTDDYYEETEKAENELRAYVLSGKFGDHLRDVVNLSPDDYRFDCRTELYQCGDCHQLSVVLQKKIIYSNRDLYTESIDFNLKCPICQSDRFRKPSGMEITCPKCHKTAKLISLGFWD